MWRREYCEEIRSKSNRLEDTIVKTNTEAVKEIVRDEMCRAYPLDPPLAVDIGAGDSWADAKG